MNLLKTAGSVCPICLKPIEASYIEEAGSVYMQKTCPDHGAFRELIAAESADYLKWEAKVTNIPPKEALTKNSKGCPHDCGPCTQHEQTACCVLLELTAGCNQSCPYCFASANADRSADPTLSEIRGWYDRLLELGEERKFNIQLSGGEPTIREDLPDIIRLGAERGFEYIQLNTNGKRLGLSEGYAQSLKDAGLTTVFLQFDGMKDEIYQELRGERLLEIKKSAVENCRKAGLPVALVPTVVKGVNEENIGELYQYLLENLDVIRGIHFQPVSFFGRFPGETAKEERVTMFDILRDLEKQTRGQIHREELYPLSTGHNLCCFYGTFLKEEDGSIKSLITGPVDCCGHGEEQSDCCCEGEDACCTPEIEVIAKDRDFVLKKWKMAEPGKEDCCYEEDGFDAFLRHFRSNSFTLTGMAFQDGTNLDTERLRKCRVQVFQPFGADGQGSLVPFCAYNLTDAAGRYLHRGVK